jgi:hypothetical protein
MRDSDVLELTYTLDTTQGGGSNTSPGGGAPSGGNSGGIAPLPTGGQQTNIDDTDDKLPTGPADTKATDENTGGSGSSRSRDERRSASRTVVLSDLAGHWSETYVVKAIELGFVSGYPDGTFKPDNAVTRAEFTKMAVDALGILGADAQLSDESGAFGDIVGHWAEQYIKAATLAKVIMGVGDNTFAPDGLIERQDAVTILARWIASQNDALADAGYDAAFADADLIGDYAREAVEQLAKAGVISGKGNGLFAPTDTLTRAEAAKLLVALLEALEL